MARMKGESPALSFVLPVADPSLRPAIEAALREHPRLAGSVTLTAGRSHDCLEACDVVLVASGTATLEAALYKRPMVVSYRMPWLSAWIMRRKGYIPYVGLPNIMAGEFVVPDHEIFDGVNTFMGEGVSPGHVPVGASALLSW